ncbi:MAG: hypothetical protein HY900_19440, partial [Deltaproteobacteria bacterium]|nr:hypothetical protein [Deltaproteobacteria bacterium]
MRGERQWHGRLLVAAASAVFVLLCTTSHAENGFVFEPAEASRGTPVDLTVKDPEFSPEAAGSVTVWLKLVEGRQCPENSIADDEFRGAWILNPGPPVDTAKRTFRLNLQRAKCGNRERPLPLGEYEVRVVTGAKPLKLAPAQSALSRRMRVLYGVQSVPEVTAIEPTVQFPDDRGFEFRILGRNFSTVPEDNRVYVEGRGTLDIQWVENDLPRRKPTRPFARVVSDREIRVWGVSAKEATDQTALRGKRRVQITVGDRDSEPTTVVISAVPSWGPRVAAAAGVLIIAVVVVWAVSCRVKTRGVATTACRVWDSLLIDPETQTYSLSKFQFYWWTGIAVFGYLYLIVARSLVQGIFDFPPIPGGLPGLVLISASTTVFAQGIAKARGTKGAGEIQPTISDFLATGGVVVPERAQFLIWTLVGGLGYLSLTLLRDVGAIEDLPKLPDGFLELMGVSSLGYLGGKFIRKPGPVIEEAGPDPVAGASKLLVKGRALSNAASIQVDGSPVIASLEVQPADKDPSTTEQDFYKAVRLPVDDPEKQKAWATGKHTLTFTNPDGQKAVREFPQPIAPPP